MRNSNQINLSKPSVQSLLINLYFNETPLSTATAFVVKSNEGIFYLVTNKHNLTGEDPVTRKCLSGTCCKPNGISIFHHRKDILGSWVEINQPLYENMSELKGPLWREHPRNCDYDVVLLPLQHDTNIVFYEYSFEVLEKQKISIRPTDVISVVGFPFGLTAGFKFPIWATGFVASEPKINCSEKPIFLIDCRSREGQSGSPVIAHRNSGAFVAMDDGSSRVFGNDITNFLGIYSGRINKESDLGIVWKPEVIIEILNEIDAAVAVS